MRNSSIIVGLLEAQESNIIIHEAAKNAFDNLALKKLPTVKSLQAEPEKHIKSGFDGRFT